MATLCGAYCYVTMGGDLHAESDCYFLWRGSVALGLLLQGP